MADTPRECRSVWEEREEVAHVLLKYSNRQALTGPEEKGHPHTWDELKHILGMHRSTEHRETRFLMKLQRER